VIGSVWRQGIEQDRRLLRWCGDIKDKAMINNFIDKRTSRIKIIGALIFCFVIAICLSLFIPYFVKKCPALVAFGIVSFALTLFIIMLLLAINGLMNTYQLRKHYPDLWKKSMCSSRSERIEAIKQTHYLNDPNLKRISKHTTKIALFCLLVWLIIFLAALCVVLVNGDDSFITSIIEKWTGAN
jgi:hypothetical protein